MKKKLSLKKLLKYVSRYLPPGKSDNFDRLIIGIIEFQITFINTVACQKFIFFEIFSFFRAFEFFSDFSVLRFDYLIRNLC